MAGWEDLFGFGEGQNGGGVLGKGGGLIGAAVTPFALINQARDVVGGKAGIGTLWAKDPAPAELNPQQQQLLALAQPGAAYGPQQVPGDQQGFQAWLARNVTDPTEVRSNGTTSAGQAMKGMGAGLQMMKQAQPAAAPAQMAPVQVNRGGEYTPAGRLQLAPGNPYLLKQRGLLDG